MLQSTASESNMFRRLWDLGYQRLVPIIPPDANISEKSSIAARMRAGDDSRGKTPGIRGDDGKWRGLSLVNMESEEADLDVWNAMGAGVGVKLGEGLVALDIDTTDADSARAIYELAAQLLGPSHVRFGNKPKCLMLYEAPHDAPYKQLRFATQSEPWADEKKSRGGARVELLTEARQFVADGTHPKTGRAYSWPQGIPRREQLTRVTQEQIDAFFERAAEQLGGDVVRRAERADTPEQEALRAPDWQTLERAVEAMPNSSAMFPSRDDYVKVAYAIKAAAPDGYELEARELYLDWCDRWGEGENEPDVALKDWERAKPPFRTGFSFIQANAPALFFEACGTGSEGASDVDDMFAAAQEATKQPHYELKSLDDLEAMVPPTFLIDRHIPEDGFGIMYGQPGSKKSFIALDMALTLAYGLNEWHGDDVKMREGRGGVLYIAGEGASGFKARVAAWKDGRLLPERRPDISFLFQPVNFMKPEDVHRLRDTVTATHPGPLALIVVDTVSRSIPGADENLQKDMTTFVAACEALRHATGAFVLGIHHTNKSGDMRGSTVFLGQADVVLRTEDVKKHNIVRLHCDKLKDGGEDGWHDAYRMDKVEVGEHEGKAITSLKAQRLEAGADVEAKRLAPELQQLMLDAMQAAWDAGEPFGKTKRAGERYAVARLSEDFGLDEEQAATMLDLWEQQGLVEVQQRDNKTKRQGYKVLGRVVMQGGVFD